MDLGPGGTTVAFECNGQGFSPHSVWRRLAVGCCSSFQDAFCLTPLFLYVETHSHLWEEGMLQTTPGASFAGLPAQPTVGTMSAEEAVNSGKAHQFFKTCFMPTTWGDAAPTL